MPYARKTCVRCDSQFRPSSRASGESCWPCRKRYGTESPEQVADRIGYEPQADPGEKKWAAGDKLQCPICLGTFTQKEPEQKSHKACASRVASGKATNPAELRKPFKDHAWRLTTARSPLQIAVFDLETFALDRGWGVLLVANILVFGDGEPKEYRFRLDQFETYKRDRSDDSEIATAVFSVLEDCHVWWAHNGKWFDVPWLNSIAMKYGLPPVERKLRDPVQILRSKMRIGSNSLEAAADFLGLEQTKMHVPAEVWRQAAFNGSPTHFDILEERCASDTALLAEVAARVEPWGGTMNYSGFYQR